MRYFPCPQAAPGPEFSSEYSFIFSRRLNGRLEEQCERTVDHELAVQSG